LTPSAANASFFAVGASQSDEPAGVADALERQLRPCSPSAVIFFASPRHDLGAVAGEIQLRFPDALTAGCTTMGEIGPDGFVDGAVVALALGSPCRIGAELLPDLSLFRFDDGAQLLERLAAQLGLAAAELSGDRHALITLTDGLSGMEEILVASLGHRLPSVPLVGGSAGDGERFAHTYVSLGSQARSGAAVILLLEPAVPFQPFLLHHYQPTSGRVVVTRADPRRRLVQALNGRPAARVLAELLQVEYQRLVDDTLGVISEHGMQFGFRVGDEHYLRSVMTVQGDALLLGGAVAEGAILTLMRAGDLVQATQQGVRKALGALGGEAAVMLAFNCGGRLFEARHLGVVDELFKATCPFSSVGFTTYGEQFGPMQVNHTLTGLLLGWPDEL